jgi:hypothetical protein
MRFSLFSFFVCLTLVTAVMGMILQYELLGLLLLFPHVAVATIVLILLRSERRVAGCVAAGVYAGCWVITGVFGIPAVATVIEDRLTNRTAGSPVYHRVDYDLEMHMHSPSVEMPWYYIRNGTTPLPFMVAVDYGVQHAPTAGGGGKVYFFWFFGYRCVLMEQLHWVS